MKELNRTNRLTIATILIILVFIVGFLTLKTPTITYTLSPQQMITQLTDNTGQVTPDEMKKIMDSKDPSWVIVDIRNPYEYQKGHIESAYNVPAIDLFENENLDFFKELLNDSKKVVIYGANQLEANGPWMLLRETGFSNANILLGGYDFMFRKPAEGSENNEENSYQVEEPAYDFAARIKEMGNNPDFGKASKTKQPEIIMPVKRTRKVEGGC